MHPPKKGNLHPLRVSIKICAQIQSKIIRTISSKSEAGSDYLFISHNRNKGCRFGSPCLFMLFPFRNECGFVCYTFGDLDGNDGVDEDDVIYLLQHLLMPEDFPL